MAISNPINPVVNVEVFVRLAAAGKHSRVPNELTKSTARTAREKLAALAVVIVTNGAGPSGDRAPDRLRLPAISIQLLASASARPVRPRRWRTGLQRPRREATAVSERHT